MSIQDGADADTVTQMMKDAARNEPMTIARAQEILAMSRSQIKIAVEAAISKIEDSGLIVSEVDISYRTLEVLGQPPRVFVDNVDIRAYISPARATAITDRG